MSDLDRPESSLDELFGPVAPGRSGPSRSKSPFKFLDPYGPDDADIFFGRSFESTELYSRFHRSRLLLVYGESGSGKSSLVQCGLRSKIPPEEALFVTVRCAVDPFGSLRRELVRLLPPGAEAEGECGELLRKVFFRKSKTVVLVLDQLEELFILQPEPVRRRLFDSLRIWLSQDIDFRAILLIRQEHLARLGEAEKVLDSVWTNRFWVRRMAPEQAREAIAKPCRVHGIGLDPQLPDLLAAEISAGGHGAELPMLQVVMETLYRHAVAAAGDRPQIDRAAYSRLGGAQGMLARFLDDQVAAAQSPDQVRQVLKCMITSEGTKRPLSARDIQSRSSQFGPEIAPAELDPLLRSLVDARVLREDPDTSLLELRHDTLAAAVSKWLTPMEEERLQLRAVVESRFKEYKAGGGLIDNAQLLGRLEPALPYLGLSEEQRRFVLLCRSTLERRRRTRNRLLAVSGATLTLVLTALLAWALWAMSVAQEERTRAEAETASKQEALAEAEKGRSEAQAARDVAEEQRRLAEAAGTQSRILAERSVSRSLTLEARGGEALGRPREESVALLRAAARPEAGQDGRIQALRGGMVSLCAQPLSHWIESPEGLRGAAGNLSLAFSPDGRILVSGGVGGVDVWDVGRGALLRTIRSDLLSVRQVAVSADGKSAVVVGLVQDHGWVTRVWAVETGELLGEVDIPDQEPDGRDMDVSLSAEGNTVAAWSILRGFDGLVLLWTLPSGAEVRIRPPERPATKSYSPTLSADGMFAGIGSVGYLVDHRNWVDVFDTRTGASVGTVFEERCDYCEVADLRLSQDGSRVLISLAAHMRAWTPANSPSATLFEPVCLKTEAGCGSNPRIWRLLPDGSSSLEGFSGPVELDAEERTTRLGPVSSRDFSRVAAVNGAASLAVWDGRSGGLLSVSRLGDTPVTDLVLSHGGGLVAAAVEGGSLMLVDTSTGAPGQPISVGEDCELHSLEFSADDAKLAATCDARIAIWDLHSDQAPRATFVTREFGLHFLSFSPDGHTLLTSSEREGAGAHAWDVPSGAHLGPAPEELEASVGAACSPWRALSGSLQQSVAIRRAGGTWLEDDGLEDYDLERRGFACTPDGNFVLTVAEDGTSALWEMKSGKSVWEPSPKLAATGAVAFSGDGKVLALATEDKSVQLLDMQSRSVLKTIAVHSGATAVALSADATILAVGARTGDVFLWDTTSRSMTRRLAGHRTGIEALLFSPGGRVLAGASRDNLARLWDIDTGGTIASLPVGTVVEVLAFSPGGNHLASLTWDGTVTLWTAQAPDFSSVWFDAGRRTNLRVCRDSLVVVPVAPYPSPDSVWADEKLCSKVELAY